MKLKHYQEKDTFLTDLGDNKINSEDICFIKDSQEIFTHDKYYHGVNKIYVGTSNTSAGAYAKSATVEAFPLDGTGKPVVGTVVAVKYSKTNAYNTEGNVYTLNVNSTGAYPMYYNNAELATSTTANTLVAGYANRYTYYVFDGSNWVWLSSGSLNEELYEAYLQWGGRHLMNSYSPIDAALVDELGACRTKFVPAEAVLVEYSRDAGETWVNYGGSAANKTALFTTRAAYKIGAATATTASVNNMLRVTLYTDAGDIYTALNKFIISIQTSGSSGCYCTIRGKTQKNYEDDVDTWNVFAEEVPLAGAPAYNVANIPQFTAFCGGSTAQKNSQYGVIQFIFGATGLSSGSTGMIVRSIYGYGGMGWTTPSTLAATGHLYGYDVEQNATFPNGVEAKKLSVTGGTSSQFLKADGSVDSNSYLTNDSTIIRELEETITDNEEVTAAALTDLNTRVSDLEINSPEISSSYIVDNTFSNITEGDTYEEAFGKLDGSKIGNISLTGEASNLFLQLYQGNLVTSTSAFQSACQNIYDRIKYNKVVNLYVSGQIDGVNTELSIMLSYIKQTISNETVEGFSHGHTIVNGNDISYISFVIIKNGNSFEVSSVTKKTLATKEYLDTQLGNIEAVLDIILNESSVEPTVEPSAEPQTTTSPSP